MSNGLVKAAIMAAYRATIVGSILAQLKKRTLASSPGTPTTILAPSTLRSRHHYGGKSTIVDRY